MKKHKNAEYFDTYALFADPEGKYTDQRDRRRRQRWSSCAGDGVHFTPEGGTISPTRCSTWVDKHCKITAQAVTGKIKLFTIQTPGSTHVAPGAEPPGGTVATTPPATSPPNTAHRHDASQDDAAETTPTSTRRRRPHHRSDDADLRPTAVFLKTSRGA